jgi:hypothetical protein
MLETQKCEGQYESKLFLILFCNRSDLEKLQAIERFIKMEKAQLPFFHCSDYSVMYRTTYSSIYTNFSVLMDVCHPYFKWLLKVIG